MRLFHGTQVEGIEEFAPRNGVHGKRYTYFASKLGHALIYAINPVEVFNKKNNLKPKQRIRWTIFDNEDGVPVLLEWWQNALEEIYKGQKAFIYEIEKTDECILLNDTERFPSEVKFYVSEKALKPVKVLVIEDMYEEIKKRQQTGEIKVRRFEELTEKQLTLIKKTATEAYSSLSHLEEYMMFIREKFPFVMQEVKNLKDE